MPYCVIANCLNNERNCSGVSFHRFPTNKNLQKAWIHACKRDDKKISVNSARVCSAHFDSDDYERDLRAELLNLKSVPRLKQNTIPHINIPTFTTKSDFTRAIIRAKKRENKKIVNSLIGSSDYKKCAQRGNSIMTKQVTVDENNGRHLINISKNMNIFTKHPMKLKKSGTLLQNPSSTSLSVSIQSEGIQSIIKEEFDIDDDNNSNLTSDGQENFPETEQTLTENPLENIETNISPNTLKTYSRHFVILPDKNFVSSNPELPNQSCTNYKKKISRLEKKIRINYLKSKIKNEKEISDLRKEVLRLQIVKEQMEIKNIQEVHEKKVKNLALKNKWLLRLFKKSEH